MILYIIYNSDLIEVPRGKNELALAFVDDTIFLATGKTFTDTHSTLSDMLSHDEGGFEWSTLHNSKFKTSKFALMDFSRNM